MGEAYSRPENGQVAELAPNSSSRHYIKIGRMSSIPKAITGSNPVLTTKMNERGKTGRLLILNSQERETTWKEPNEYMSEGT